MNIRSHAFTSMIFCTVSAAHAAAPAGQLSCVLAQLPGEQPVLQANPSGLLQGNWLDLS